MAGIRSAGISGLLVKIVTFFGAEYINIYVPYTARERTEHVCVCVRVHEVSRHWIIFFHDCINSAGLLPFVMQKELK